MKFQEIQKLIQLLADSNVSELNIKEGEFEITIQTDKVTQQVVVSAPSAPAAIPIAAASPAPVAAAAAAEAPAEKAPAKEKAEEASASGVEQKSPMIGTFYRKSGPDKPAFVKIGDTVKKGDVICIIEAMKLFNEIESDHDGVITKILVDDASPVEFGQPLFLIDPA
ncbi:MAG: acetyl-CoA carboxylase biotin carboxyl carrier protein [Chitinophagales bacterium]